MKTILIVIIILVALGIAGYVFMQKKPEISLSPSPSPTASITTTPMTDITELKVETIAEGTGPGAKNGDKLSVLYTGTLTNGTVFDASSLHENKPFEFTLGAGGVIKGFDQGLLGVKKGEKRRISIPAELAYGKDDLIFEVEIVSIVSPK